MNTKAATPISGIRADASGGAEGMGFVELTERSAADHCPPPWSKRSALLRFFNASVESAYLQYEYLKNRRLIGVGAVIVATLVVIFLWADMILAPPEIKHALQIGRLTVGIPCAIGAVLGAIFSANAKTWHRCVSTLFSIYLFEQCVLLLLIGHAAFNYLSYGVLEGVLGTFLVSNLPVRISMAISAAGCLLFTSIAFYSHVDATTYVDQFGADALIFLALATLAVYRYESASRAQFVAQRLLELSHQQQLAAESDRRHWLESIAGFLGHELKNAMIGIASSIELAGREKIDVKVREYLDRASQSVEFMRRLLGQVSTATSLESALRSDDSKAFDLGSLVVDQLEAFRESHPSRTFVVSVAPDVCVIGSTDAARQMLDKLVENSIEHGDPFEPIKVELTRVEKRCTLAVSDIGDALPADIDRIFDAFVTKKGSSFEAGNLGLGLFVAKTIAAHFGGSLRVEQLTDPNGARFVVSCPCSAIIPGLRPTDTRDFVHF